jgi:phenylalanyl-tRNA synthetase alpha chain
MLMLPLQRRGGGLFPCGGGWNLGSGMVDPAMVVHYDLKPVSPSAWADEFPVQYGITDIRLFFNNDLRFLRQF